MTTPRTGSCRRQGNDLDGRMTRNLEGALWILLSCLAATVMTTAVKLSTEAIASPQIVFLRCLISLGLFLPFLIWQGVSILKSRHKGRHLLRAFLGAVAMNAGFHSLAHLPLTTASVLFFSTPLFLTALAIPMLGETVGWRRWAATLFGFAGIVVVMRPDVGEVHYAMGLALVSAGLFAVMLLMGKQLSREDPPATLMTYFIGMTVLVTFPPAVPVWVWPDEAMWGVLFLVGLGATLRVYFDIKAYAIAEASAIAPFQYIRLITIAIAGYFVFGEVPDGPTIVGALMIIGSSIYIAHRESSLGRDTGRAKAPAGGDA